MTNRIDRLIVRADNEAVLDGFQESLEQHVQGNLDRNGQSLRIRNAVEDGPLFEALGMVRVTEGIRVAEGVLRAGEEETRRDLVEDRRAETLEIKYGLSSSYSETPEGAAGIRFQRTSGSTDTVARMMHEYVQTGTFSENHPNFRPAGETQSPNTTVSPTQQ